MALQIRSTSEFLGVLEALVKEPQGAAVLEALANVVASRQQGCESGPLVWSVSEVIAELAERPAHVTLFGAIRLLQGAQPQKPALGYSRRADDDAVRLDQTLLLGFAPSEVDAIGLPGDAGRPKLAQSAIGLLGPNGAMPYRWTEFAHDLANSKYRSERDVSFLAWLNVIQRRQLALLYRAWSDSQAVTGADSPGHPHPVADRLMALSGLVLEGLRGRDSIDDTFKMAFAAPLSRRVRNPGPLASMLSQYFGVPVRIEEFVAQWLAIPADQQSSLGVRFTTLGNDAVAGNQVYDCVTRFRIVIGPLSLSDYRRFLPIGDHYTPLRDLVSLYVGVEHEWDVVPILKFDEVPPGHAGTAGFQLGWTTWLGQRESDVDADDLALSMTPSLGAAGTDFSHQASGSTS